MLTQTNKDNYIGKDGVFCPYCGSTIITAGHMEFNDESCHVDVHCQICSKRWVDRYTLTDILEDE